MAGTPASIATKRFQTLIHDLPEHDLAALLKVDDLCSHLKIFDFDTRTTSDAVGLPWPIIWLLARAHPKHIYLGKAPTSETVANRVQNFLRKIRWRIALRDDSFVPPFKVSKPKITSPCWMPTPPHATLWSALFGWAFMKHVSTPLAKLKAYNTSCTPRMVKWAMQVLKRQNLAVLPSDKDGGVVLLKAPDIERLESQIFLTETYEYLDMGTTSAYIREAVPAIKSLAVDIAAHENMPRLAAHILKPIFRGDSAVSRLQMTLKTHKPQGEIKPRALHCAPSYAYEGVGRWLSRELRRKLDPFKHLVKNAADAKRQMSSATLVGTEELVKLDIKDFYLSGTCEQITNTIAPAFNDDHRLWQLVKRALEFLLQHQFVRGRFYVADADHGSFRCVRGSGMGLPHSGDIADLCLLLLIELWLLRPCVRAKCGIAFYLRFRDDALLAIAPKRLDRVLDHIRVQAKFFKVEEESRNIYAKFLNLKVFRVGSTIVTKYYRKETNVCLPLPANSGQHPSIHRTWPVQLLRSIDGLCSRQKHALEAVESLQHRFSEAIVPILWPKDVRQHVCSIVSKPATAANQTLWMPLPYHPAVARIFQTALRLSMEELRPYFNVVFGKDGLLDIVNIRIAWSNHGRPLIFVLRQLSEGGGRG